MEYHGLDFGGGPLGEGAVFGFSGGLSFFYLEMAGLLPPLYLVGRTADLEISIAEHLGVGLQVRQTDDPVAGWRWVRDEVDRGFPPMVWADIGHLEYLRVRMHNTRHDIVVAGYDEKAGIAWIADNDRDELQRCSLESLARARSSDAFPGPNRHTTFIYDWPSKLADPRHAARDAVARAIANMRAPARDSALLDAPGVLGLDGVSQFARAYARWPQVFGDELPDALRGLSVFIVKAGTGGAMFRSLQADFFADIADLLGDEQLRPAAKRYGELAGAWRALAACAQANDHRGGMEAVAAINELEGIGVQTMSRWLEAQST